MCIFFPRNGLRIYLPFHFRLCTFPEASLLREGCCFSGFLLPVSLATLWGLYVSLLSRFGHDRAKNDSGIDFPCPSCESLVLLPICRGWSSDCVGMGMKDWVA